MPTVSAAPAGRGLRIAIVGGGLAGLNAALHLKWLGLEAIVYEARHRLGGRVLSARHAVGDGLILDVGGAFISSDHADLLDLARRFELPLFDRAADARRRPFPSTGYFLGGRVRSETEVADALRPLAARIAADAERLDIDFERFGPEFDRLSVTQYLDRNADAIGEPFARTLVEAGIRAGYGVEPSQSSALQLLFTLPTVDGRAVEATGSSDQRFCVRGGSSRFTTAFAARLHGQIQLGQRLVRLQANGSGFRLTFRGQPVPLWRDPLSEADPDEAVSTHLPAGIPAETEVDADYVILAMPFSVLREVELPDLPAPLRRFIDEAELGRAEKVFAGFETRAWRRNAGFASGGWTDLGFAHVWDETQRQRERSDGALTFFAGGREVDPVVVHNAETVGAEFVMRLDDVVAGVAAVTSGRWFRSKWTHDPFCRGAFASFRPGQLTRFAPHFWIEGETPAETQEVAVGNLLFAGEHLSDAYYGSMNGAAQTGRLAATALAFRLTGRSQSAAALRGSGS